MKVFCGKCGTRLDPTTGLCPNCEPGPITIPETPETNEISETPETPGTDKKSGKSKMIIPVVAAVIVVVTVITIILLLHFGVISKTGESETDAATECFSVTENTAEVKLSPEEAVKIYEDNMDVWLIGEDPYAGDGSGDSDRQKDIQYQFIDFDFDGILELESDVIRSGFTHKDFYRINTSDNTVVQLYSSAFQDMGFERIDRLYENKNDGSKFYLGITGNCDEIDGIVSYFCGAIGYTHEDDNDYVCEHSDYSVYEEISADGKKNCRYFYGNDDDDTGREESEQEYKKRVADFNTTYTDLDLSRGYITQGTLCGTSKKLYEGEKATLLEAYKSFCYNGFSFDDNTSNDADHKEITETTTAQTETTTVPPETTTKREVTEKPAVDYAELYANILRSRLSDSGVESMTFALVYIDRDEIPELLISTGTSHVNGVDIYTIRNGRCTKAGDAGPYGGMRYVPYGSIVESKYSGMGAVILTYKKMTSNGFDTVQEFQTSDDIPSPGRHFYVNNNEVSENQYNASYNAYISKYSFTTFENENGSAVNSDNISKFISDPTKFIL